MTPTDYSNTKDVLFMHLIKVTTQTLKFVVTLKPSTVEQLP